MSVYKRYSDETKYMYFMVKDEKHFHKYMKFGNIIKKINSELAYNKKYLKVKKLFNKVNFL